MALPNTTMSESKNPIPENHGAEFYRYVELVENYDVARDQPFVVFLVQSASAPMMRDALNNAEPITRTITTTARDPKESILVLEKLQNFAQAHGITLPPTVSAMEIRFMFGLHGVEVRVIPDHRRSKTRQYDAFFTVRLLQRSVFDAVCSFLDMYEKGGVLHPNYSPPSDATFHRLMEVIHQYCVVFALDIQTDIHFPTTATLQ